MKKTLYFFLTGAALLTFFVDCLAVLTPKEDAAYRDLENRKKLHRNTYTGGGNVPANKIMIECNVCNWTGAQLKPGPYEGCPNNAKAIQKYIQEQRLAAEGEGQKLKNLQLKVEEEGKRQIAVLKKKVSKYSKLWKSYGRKVIVIESQRQDLERHRTDAIKFCVKHKLDWPTDLCPKPSDFWKFL